MFSLYDLFRDKSLFFWVQSPYFGYDVNRGKDRQYNAKDTDASSSKTVMDVPLVASLDKAAHRLCQDTLNGQFW